MNDWHEDLRAWVIANATLTAVIGTRFHWLQLPDATYPATRFFAVSRDPNTAHDGSGGHEVLYVQLDHIDTSYANVRAAALAFKSELNGNKISANNFTGAMLMNELEEFRDTPETVRVSQEYLLHHAE